MKDFQLKYPVAEKSDQVDMYHGVAVSDPFRGMEIDSSTRQKWIDDEINLTSDYIGSRPQRPLFEAIANRVWRYPVKLVPKFSGGRWFTFFSDGVSAQRTIVSSRRLKTAKPWRTIVDPNTWSDSGAIALQNFIPSPDGKLLLCSHSWDGAYEAAWRIVDTNTGITRPDVITANCRPVWSADSKGIYNCERHQVHEVADGETTSTWRPYVRYHAVGTSIRKDFWAATCETGWLEPLNSGVDKYLLLRDSTISDKKAPGRVLLIELGVPEAKPVTLFGGQIAKYVLVEMKGDVAYFITDLDAPRGRLISVNLNDGAAADAVTVIAEQTLVLNECAATKEHFVAEYLEGPASRLHVYDLEGRWQRQIDLPTVGTVLELSAVGAKSNDVLYSFDSVATPGIILRVCAKTGRQAEILRKRPPGFNADNYETILHFADSKDGTKIPFLVTQKKGTVWDGSNFACLYAYAGFGISSRPRFDKFNIPWLEAGGVYVTACARGGGEYGRDWHEAACKLSKQKSFDDVIAVAEWLTAHGVTQPSRLALRGGSNGGLTMAACMVQRPELFGAVIAQSGPHDVLRYHKISGSTAWSPDYGTSEDEAEFHAILQYTPIQNVRPNTVYPAVYLEAGMNDGVVAPAHSFKLLAALQEAQSGTQPILGAIRKDSGHAAGTDAVASQIRLVVDVWTFAASTMGMTLQANREERLAS